MLPRYVIDGILSYFLVPVLRKASIVSEKSPFPDLTPISFGYATETFAEIRIISKIYPWVRGSAHNKQNLYLGFEFRRPISFSMLLIAIIGDAAD